MTPLQKAAQALMDAMAQTDFTCRLGEQLDACEKALDAEIAQAVEPDKFGKCIDDFGNSLVSVGDHVESSEAIFFVGAISDGGLCSIDTKKPFYAKSSGPMSKCVTQGNYAAKATALSFVYLQHPPQPQATTPVPDMFWNRNDSEQCHDSIGCFLNDEICNGFLEVGTVFTIMQAKRLPDVQIKVTNIDDEECEAEYEVITAAQGEKP